MIAFLIFCLSGPDLIFDTHDQWGRVVNGITRSGCLERCLSEDWDDCCWPNYRPTDNPRTWWEEWISDDVECLVCDYDGDGDVDLRDYAVYQREGGS